MDIGGKTRDMGNIGLTVIALAYHCSFVDFDCFHCPHL